MATGRAHVAARPGAPVGIKRGGEGQMTSKHHPECNVLLHGTMCNCYANQPRPMAEGDKARQLKQVYHDYINNHTNNDAAAEGAWIQVYRTALALARK